MDLSSGHQFYLGSLVAELDIHADFRGAYAKNMHPHSGSLSMICGYALGFIDIDIYFYLYLYYIYICVCV